MKKHHLFLLIVSLLLAASFIVPATTPTSTASHTSEWSLSSPITYFIYDFDSTPTQVLPGSIFKFLEKREQLSSVQNNTIYNLQLLKKHPQTGALVNALENPHLPKETIQTANESKPETYFVMTLPYTPGEYILDYDLAPTYGQFYDTNTSTKKHISHSLTIATPTPEHIKTIVQEGNDGTS